MDSLMLIISIRLNKTVQQAAFQLPYPAKKEGNRQEKQHKIILENN